MKKFTMSLLLIFALGVTSVMAQGRTVSGKVTDSGTGLPIVGAMVVVTGTQNGAYTMEGGEFIISNVEGAVNLEATFMGYTDKVVVVSASQTNVDIELTPSAMQMDEVVVVAYGTADKKSLTGSVAVISSEDIESRPIANVASAISGMSAGIITTTASGEPGSSAKIRIRGISSINSSSDPLYVVDGIPFAGDISNISPEDIQSMSVLKDAASTALYGSKASSGVIMIQTKTGRAGKVSFDVKITQGFQYRSVPEYDKVGPEEFYGLAWESQRNREHFINRYDLEESGNKATASMFGTSRLYNVLQDNSTGALMANSKVFQPQSWEGYKDANWKKGAIHSDASMMEGYNGDFDWMDAMEGLGYRQNYNISATGGTEKSTYYTSIGYLDEDSYVMGGTYSRLSTRNKVDVTPTKWLKLGSSVYASYSDKSSPNVTGAADYSNPWRFARTIAPVFPVHLHDMNTGKYILDANGGKMYDMGGGYTDPATGNVLVPVRGVGVDSNPLYFAENNIYDTNTLSLDASVYAQITFLKDFKLTVDGAVNNRYTRFKQYWNPNYGDGSPDGKLWNQSYDNLTNTFKQMLEWNRSFDKHSVDVLVGHEYFEKNYEFLQAGKQGEITPGSEVLDNFTTMNSIVGYDDAYRSEGYFGRFNYNYDDKYFVTASYRRDGSSKFSPENRWGNFWSVGASWIVSSEEFMADVMWVDYLKLRASYGTNGNDGGFTGTDVGYYAWQSLYSYESYMENAALYMSTVGTPLLQWETLGALDIGVDFRLWNRVNGTIGYFEKSSNELIFDVPIPNSSGIIEMKDNVGSMVNRGLELSFDVDVIRTKDWLFNVGLNLTWMKNEITKLPGHAAENGIESGSKKLMEGYSIYEFWLPQFVGVDTQDGASLYIVDEDKESANDIIVGDNRYTKLIGSAKKDFSGDALAPINGALSTSLAWKNLSLDLLFTYRIGGKAYDSSHMGLMEGTVTSAWSVDMLDSWRKPGDVTSLPRFAAGDSNQYSRSTRHLINNSFFALQNVTLTYKFPKKIANKLTLNGLSVYASGENLFQVSGAQGFDAQSQFAGYVDNSRYGSVATISFGINVSF